jgi:serine phosphatase RsbU (regulator of sigma subunit)
MTPAREVGGDFYDAFFIDADTLFIATGDVCGKGVPAALFMVRTLTVLRSEASRRLPARKPDIRAIMKRANDLLSTGNESSMFASVFTGLLDLKSGLLSYVNAGHNPPLLAPGSDACRLLAEPRSLALGIREGFDFRAGEARLSKDSVLLLYTDGVTEAEGRGEQQFGEDRLCAVFEQSRRAGASALIAAVLSAVQAFQAGREQTDDITLLALRYIPGS